MGYVYLLLQIDENNNESHKIGITKRKPEIRISELQTGNPFTIRLLRSYESNNYLKVEHWMHRKHFASKTETKNEWRTLPAEAVFSFLDDCKEADDTIKFLKENNSLYD